MTTLIQVPVPTLAIGAFDLLGATIFAKILSTGSRIDDTQLGSWARELEPAKESWLRVGGELPSESFRLACVGQVDVGNLSWLDAWRGQHKYLGRDVAATEAQEWNDYTPPDRPPAIFRPVTVNRTNPDAATGIDQVFAVSFEGLDASKPFLHWYRTDATVDSPFYCENAPFVPAAGDVVTFQARPLTGAWKHRAIELAPPR